VTTSRIVSHLDIRVPEALAVLPGGYRALFDRAVAYLSSDERVRALWLHGSLARGDADSSSDLDLLVAVTDEGFDGVWSTWPDWLARITPTVLARAIPWAPGILYSLTPECLRLDIVLERVSAVPTSGFHARDVVFDRDSLDAKVPPAPPPPGPDLGKMTFAIEEPLRYLAMLPAMLDRGELMLIQEAYGHVRRRISELFIEANALNAAVPTTGVKHWRDKLTDEQHARLESLPWPQATVEELIDAHLVIGRAHLEAGHDVAARAGIEWPQALEDAVRAHLQRELNVEL
jgi:hypothetical protein